MKPWNDKANDVLSNKMIVRGEKKEKENSTYV